MKKDCHDCCSPQQGNAEACGCCEGVEVITPESTYNRPGLSAINYRIGSHGSFLETMTARLAGYYLEKQDADGNTQKTYPLQGLTTRKSDDPALAMLDAWSTVADVLTFYQERIANEGYLRTATERRSVLEMAQLVGYKPRPGVSSSVFLAYTLDKNHKEETVIPAGSRTQSIPGPDELPQSFETSEDLKARAQWNNLKPRMVQPQTESTIKNNGILNSVITGVRIYLQGISTNIKTNDAIRIDFYDEDLATKTSELYFVNEILPDSDSNHTLVIFSEQLPFQFTPLPIDNIIQNLSLSASVQPANSLQLDQNLRGQFAPVAQAGYSVLGAVSSVFRDNLTKIVASNKITSDNNIEVYVLGIKANLFGHNLPLPDVRGNCFSIPNAIPSRVASAVDASNSDGLRTLALDSEYSNIKVGDRVVIKKNNKEDFVFSEVMSIKSMTLGGPQDDGSLSFFSTCPTITSITTPEGHTTVTVSEPVKVKVTVLTLGSEWRTQNDTNAILKTTTVYIQSGIPQLAEEPITAPIGACTDDNDQIELDNFYDGLEAGRWVIVSGERNDLSGVRFSELAMLASVTHDIAKSSDGKDLPGETSHTYIKFAENLAYCFKRNTVTIHGNVVKATHGETRQEVLGSGDGAKSFQSFELKQFPLTHVSASNPTGVDSTLKMFVNNIQWHESDSLVSLQKNDRQFITKTDNEDKTTVIFGNGKKGARLPTGIENIRTEYRNGIGKPGNVKAEQISLLTTKPLGVKEVINPLRASGGANRETRDQARKHVPLAVKALDRLVSVQDYEDFSRIYAGIGKAHAVELSNGRQQLVHVTIAGAEDIPIDYNSDLFKNLRRALHDFGDPYQAIRLDIRELKFIVIQAGVVILPDYQWESVEPILRQRLLDAFSFERQELGQDVVLSEVISVMQSVRGVAYVDVDVFGGIPEKKAEDDGSRRLLTPDEIAEEVSGMIQAKVSQRLPVNLAEMNNRDGAENRNIRPAQIAFLTPDVPATLILNQIERLS